jgi:hypothetical protein
MIFANFIKRDRMEAFIFFAEGDGISRFSSGKPGSFYPVYPVNSV